MPANFPTTNGTFYGVINGEASTGCGRSLPTLCSAASKPALMPDRFGLSGASRRIISKVHRLMRR